jgi:hypothetical protein
MAYIDKEGAKAQPIMIHRAIFGSLERFFGILVENYAGGHCKGDALFGGGGRGNGGGQEDPCSGWVA